MGVAAWTGAVIGWKEELAAFKLELEPVFARRELKETFGLFLDGLFSGAERKTGWLMAEWAGLERPYRIQSLLGRSRWRADDLRDAVRSYAVAALGDPDGVLIVDETGFVKKGAHSVGVARQYSGTAGRIENCQVGVFLAYATVPSLTKRFPSARIGASHWEWQGTNRASGCLLRIGRRWSGGWRTVTRRRSWFGARKSC